MGCDLPLHIVFCRMTHNDFRNICRTTFFLHSLDADPHRDALLTCVRGWRERRSERVLSVERPLLKKEGKTSEGWENPFSRFRPPSVYKTRGWKKAGKAHKWGIKPSGFRLRPILLFERYAPPWGFFKSTRDTHLETCPGQGPSTAWPFKSTPKRRHRGALFVPSVANRR